MKTFILLSLMLLGVMAQAQIRTWEPSAFAAMQENCRILAKPTTAENVQKALGEAMKNAFTYPANPVQDKEGDVPAKRLNIWKLKGKTGAFLKWDYIVTVDVVWGQTGIEMPHPEFAERTLITGNYIVPQDIKPTYKFYRPTLKEYKKLSPELQKRVDMNLLLLKKLTKGELKKMGY